MAKPKYDEWAEVQKASELEKLDWPYNRVNVSDYGPEENRPGTFSLTFRYLTESQVRDICRLVQVAKLDDGTNSN